MDKRGQDTDKKIVKETWEIHESASSMSQNIMQLFPIFKIMHSTYPKDIIHVDFTRIHLLFDENGKSIESRFDNMNPFWTQKNPFPINSISDDETIVSIWDKKIPGSSQLIFPQNKAAIKKIIKHKNREKNAARTILLVGTHINVKTEISQPEPTSNIDQNKTVYQEICLCYIIKFGNTIKLSCNL